MTASRIAAFAGGLLLATTTLTQAQKALTYTVNIDPKTDANLFQVQLEVPKLHKEQSIYQFAATAPGTYQVMDIGRFVRKFEAFDAQNKPLEVKQASVNQWQLLQPEKTRFIRYTIAETWDTPVTEHRVYRMCGTSLEADHALLNGQGIFGYLQGWQGKPLRIKLNYPADWKIGTPLTTDKQGYYTAATYDQAVDSPFLLGRLTEAKTKLGDAEVALYCYSKTDQVKAEPLLGYMQQMLQAAQAFLVQLPVKRYTFLYHFDDQNFGAWEHSYSSEYVLRETPLTPESANLVTSIAAHEFFHVVTPLNIHSEIIEQFNFVQPTGSEHLWLYEGTTEWASGMMKLRGALVTLDEYLQEMSGKVAYAQTQTDTTYSLSKLGLNSFTDEGQRQYGNIYQRGALTAALLDLRLLELSGGKRGLREVMNELTKRYGPNKPFSEKDFFTEFTKLTYPEIQDFFNRYVKQAEPLPLQEYYAKVGIRYTPVLHTGQQVVAVGTANPSVRYAGNAVQLTEIPSTWQSCGVAVGDELVAINGTAITPTSIKPTLMALQTRKAGEEYELTLRRAGTEQKVRCRLIQQEQIKRYNFAVLPDATPAQLALRQAWLKNL
ncbi:M61 family metallopeptidase [Hymenobacter chitinivorans]|uniref:Putative metalloprotease with PDZ domain n=1 Tax=Hymenobacter chitinivorans DSM 11115 TaxID=1121954 RepID=A0A2M9AS71_9BACT|nr:peptidase [Hymenobacter chitinivorans]PJJ48555.1 putative metalloprotease with PDZ domain [Hymenobacter chitinivorans DSM 11115]